MKPIRVVIVDDEPLARENMRDLLSAYPEVVVVGEAGTVDEARQVLGMVRPDAVFLDIQIPGGTGFDALSGLVQPPQVVFVTAYDEYAVRAFQVNAIDYLLKPIDRRLLERTVHRLAADNSLSFGAGVDKGNGPLPFRRDDEVLVQEKDACFLIPLQTLCAIRAYRNYTEAINTENQTYLFRWPLKEWAGRLPAPPFLRLDRSLIINFDRVNCWQLKGRGMELTFENRIVILGLGRVASERFKRFIEGHGPTAKESPQPDTRL